MRALDKLIGVHNALKQVRPLKFAPCSFGRERIDVRRRPNWSRLRTAEQKIQNSHGQTSNRNDSDDFTTGDNHGRLSKGSPYSVRCDNACSLVAFLANGRRLFFRLNSQDCEMNSHAPLFISFMCFVLVTYPALAQEQTVRVGSVRST